MHFSLSLPEIARVVVVFLLYVATAKLGLMYTVVGNSVTLAWPPSGIALAAILVYGYRLVPGIALGAFLANAWTGVPLLTACGIAIGNTLEALTGAFLLNRLAQFRNSLDRLRDVFAFFTLAATCSTMISAGIGVVALALGGVIPLSDYGGVWLKWWLGDMMGILVVAPPLLVWLSHPHPRFITPEDIRSLGSSRCAHGCQPCHLCCTGISRPWLLSSGARYLSIRHLGGATLWSVGGHPSHADLLGAGDLGHNARHRAVCGRSACG